MPTIRSKFSIQQFEEVLQKLAHMIAIDAVTTLKRGRCRIIISGPELREVFTDQYEIKFYASHVSFSKKLSQGEWLVFDAEEKLYLTSNHCSKIGFWAPDEKKEEQKKKILAFIDNLMAEAGVSIEPHFQLAQMTE